jgi:hypothetical protein
MRHVSEEMASTFTTNTGQQEENPHDVIHSGYW